MKVIINQDQKKFLFENNNESLKNLLINLGLDLTDKISIVQFYSDIPSEFRRASPPDYTRSMLNSFGPMFLIDIDGEKFLYQNRPVQDWFIDKNGVIFTFHEIPGLEKFFSLGLKFSEIIDLFWEDDFY